MDIRAQFNGSSDEDLLLMWVKKAELPTDTVQALQAELERRQLAKMVHTIAGWPRLELLKTPPISHERHAPNRRTMHFGVARSLFAAGGFLLCVIVYRSIPSINSHRNTESFITSLALIVLTPLVVFLVLNRVWKPFALLVTAIVATGITAALLWYGYAGHYQGGQLRQAIEESTAKYLSLRNKFQADLDGCRVPEVLELLDSPEKLTEKNLEDAHSRITTAQTLMEDYRNQFEKWFQGLQKTLQPIADQSQTKNWFALKEALLREPEWLAAQNEYFKQISEFVRYLRYYRHLYRIDNQKVVFNEAEGRQNYEYYKSALQQYSERQKQMDEALSARMRQLISNNSTKGGGE